MPIVIRTLMAPLIVLVSGVAVAVFASGGAQRPATPAPAPATNAKDATASIVAAAQAVLSTLDETGRAKTVLPFDEEHRTKWSNLPIGIVPRLGLRMGDLTPPQRAAVTKLLQTALSANGFRKVTDIVRGDEVLRTKGQGGGRVRFGEDEYYLAFLGAPSTTTPWLLQFGGHHLAINLTLAGSQASMTPSLPAAQPATYSFEGREIRPLGKEHDKAFALVNTLDATQQGQAVLNYRVSDLVLGPGKDGRTIQPEGIRASALSSPQQEALLEIVNEWAGLMNDAFAGPRMAEIRANLPQTWFAWSGPTTSGSAAYFRVQGPTLVIEYAPQGGIDHIHTIYRDPTNDYGAKFTAK